jgi:hypothetical protein
MKMRPDVGASTPVITLISVDLPAPSSPISPTISFRPPVPAVWLLVLTLVYAILMGILFVECGNACRWRLSDFGCEYRRSLTSGQVTSFYNRLRTYMTAVGVS